jgi:hypothetical protein
VEKRESEIIIEKLRGASPRECARLVKKIVKLKTKGERNK